MASTAEAFDATEPVERLPRLTKGNYLLQVDATDYREFSDATIAEFTVLESEGDDALPKGTRCSHYLGLAVTKKNAPYVAKRVKGFVYPLENRRNIPGAELDEMIRTLRPGPWAGKQIRAEVSESTDKEGNVKTNDEGVAYLDVDFSAA